MLLVAVVVRALLVIPLDINVMTDVVVEVKWASVVNKLVLPVEVGFHHSLAYVGKAVEDSMSQATIGNLRDAIEEDESSAPENSGKASPEFSEEPNCETCNPPMTRHSAGKIPTNFGLLVRSPSCSLRLCRSASELLPAGLAFPEELDI
eukprot:1947476-Amphidinium_carterae.1